MEMTPSEAMLALKASAADRRATIEECAQACDHWMDQEDSAAMRARTDDAIAHHRARESAFKDAAMRLREMLDN